MPLYLAAAARKQPIVCRRARSANHLRTLCACLMLCVWSGCRPASTSRPESKAKEQTSATPLPGEIDSANSSERGSARSSTQLSDPGTVAPPPAAGVVSGSSALPPASQDVSRDVSRDATAGATPSPAGAAAGRASSAPKQRLPEPTPDDAGGEDWLAADKLPYEYWEAQYLNASPVGVTHYRVEQTQTGALNLTAVTTLQVRRGGQPLNQTVSVQTLELPSGEVQSFFEQADGGGASTKTEGSVSNEVLPLKIVNGQNQSAAQVQWPKGTWGPMGVQQLLLRKPMQRSERRQTHIFLPQIHQVALVTLTAADKEEDATAPDGMLRNLLPIDVLMQLENQGVNTRVWIDAQGQVQKSVMLAGLNLSSYRVPREFADQLRSQGMVDVFAATSIKIPSPLVDAEQAKRIDYVIESKSTDPYRLLSREANQSVRSESPFRALLSVWRPEAHGAAPEAVGTSGPVQTPPSKECSQPSTLINSDDPAVATLATALAQAKSEPTDMALALTEGVFKSIRKKNFSKTFDSARDVAKTLEGDCTEHAVLLCALLRNRGIPARIASGLIATGGAQETTFAYHMWSEAWVGERWLPLDATQGGVAGCGHIKFFETPLSERNPYSALLPVLTALGQMTIAVGEVVR